MGYEEVIKDTFRAYPKAMLCVKDLERLRVL